MVKLAVVAGTRPEYIQVEPILRVAYEKKLETIFINTGQHYDYNMSRVFFEELDLPEPDYNLEPQPKRFKPIFGSGNASQKIIEHIIDLEVAYEDKNRAFT